MNTLRIVRYAAWGAVAFSLFVLGAVTLGWYVSENGRGPTASVGGPFSLVDHTGRRVTEKEFAGKPLLIFFGFTHCPDVCPTTLYEASGWLDALGPNADRLNLVFVSVDPERDTVPVLAEYMTAFDPRMRALTGSSEDIAQIAKAYRVYYRKVPLETGSYTMDHSASVYMMDADGRFVGTISPQEPKEQALAKVRRLLS